jgi:hypothetical protein
MLALYIAAVVVAVERFINRQRLKVHEILRDVGWLTLLFALIEFAYLMVVEAATLNFGSTVRALWYTEWGVFKNILLEVATATMLILTSAWIESVGIELLPPRPAVLVAPPKAQPKAPPDATPQADKCDVEW